MSNKQTSKPHPNPNPSTHIKFTVDAAIMQYTSHELAEPVTNDGKRVVAVTSVSQRMACSKQKKTYEFLF